MYLYRRSFRFITQCVVIFEHKSVIFSKIGYFCWKLIVLKLCLGAYSYIMHDIVSLIGYSKLISEALLNKWAIRSWLKYCNLLNSSRKYKVSFFESHSETHLMNLLSSFLSRIFHELKFQQASGVYSVLRYYYQYLTSPETTGACLKVPWPS